MRLRRDTLREKVAPVEWHNEFLRKLTDDVTQSPELDARLEILLTDYLVTTHAGRGRARTGHLGANLAMNSTSDDRDDIDWSVMTHPGSIVWSAIFHQLLMHPNSSAQFKAAAYSAYRTSASVAGMFGKSHRVKWHVTTTAGSFAAATASNVMLNLTRDQALSSLLHVAANMGGIAIADRRTGAAIFNRSAAVALGILSSESAYSGIPNATNIWQGERGLIQLFSLQDNPELAVIRDGISTAGLRLFPCNGFVQGAYRVIVDARKVLAGELISMKVGLAAAGLPLLDGSVGGDYWNAQHAAAKAWAGSEVESHLTLVEIAPSDIPLGGAEVEITTLEGHFSQSIEEAPGLNFHSLQESIWRDEKHHQMIGVTKTEQAKRLARELLSNSCVLEELDYFIR